MAQGPAECSRRVEGEACRSCLLQFARWSEPYRSRSIDETSPYHPYINHGRSKMQMELLVKEWRRSTIWKPSLCVPMVLRHRPASAPDLVPFDDKGGEGADRWLWEQSPFDGDIDNLCEGLPLPGSTGRACGQTYWIAHRRRYPMNQIVDTVERLLESEFKLPVAHKRLRLPSWRRGRRPT